MIGERIPLEPCHPGCTKPCARNRRMLHALLVSIGIPAGRRTDAPPPPPDASTVRRPDSSRRGATARAGSSLPERVVRPGGMGQRHGLGP